MTSRWGRIGVVAFVVATTILLRLAYWAHTGETLEDSLITLRYADNIAGGRGFVYNTGEHVLGTTTPLWTLLLAATRTLGVTDVISAAKIIGIACDVGTLMLLLLMLDWQRHTAFLFFGLLFATSPWIVRISVSGMETPVVLLSMSIALVGLERRSHAFGVGIALTVLTRIDGAVFAGCMLVWAFFNDRRWTSRQACLALLLCLPWMAFAWSAFGSVIPQSFVAKRAVYQFGVATSAAPYLNAYTPFAETDPAKFAVKLCWCIAVLGGIAALIRQRGTMLPLAAYFLVSTTMAMLSGMMIFSWYLVPGMFAASIGVAVAAGAAVDAVRTARPAFAPAVLAALLIAFTGMDLSALHASAQRSKDTQGVETSLRRKIGEWLRDNTPPQASVLMEPIGYIGYYAGPERRIWDEIGLVTPAIVALRRAGPGWYVSALELLDPDYLVQYAAALDRNTSEGTGDPLFTGEDQSAWFRARYTEVARFSVRGMFPRVAEKEKEYVVLKKRRLPLPPPASPPGG